MILLGCQGLGAWYRGQFLGRIRDLRTLRQILDLWESEVRYGKATLGECCLRMQRQLREPFRSCFERLNGKLREANGESCGKIFREVLTEGMRGLPLRQEDRDAFFQFIPENGYMDRQMQLLSIQRSRALLESTLEELEKENAEKCRLALGLGAMSGMLLVLILW
ncbi:MAG: stage III sporulation protein AB [Eubacterium sp.]|nr:stage III sporulation protein AB [Eubacterium sp.]